MSGVRAGDDVITGAMTSALHLHRREVERGVRPEDDAVRADLLIMTAQRIHNDQDSSAWPGPTCSTAYSTSRGFTEAAELQ